MNAIERRIRIACIDVYDEPDSTDARTALGRALITATPATMPTATDTAQRLRTACTDLYDEPLNRAAQLHVLELLGIPPLA